MITATRSVDKLTVQWRRQILAHRDPQWVAARKGFVAASFIDQSNARSAFVDIDNLLVVLLYEDEFHGSGNTPRMRVPLRLVAYGASRTPHGVQWGEAANSRLFKDLMLTPQFRARGQRVDRDKSELLSLALKLDRRLSRAARHPAAPWPELRLPRLWAAFRYRDATHLRAEGPEFEAACRHGNGSETDVLQTAAQRMPGLTLYPLDWISNQLDYSVAMFAEVTPSLRRQTCRIQGVPDGLIGYQVRGAFDFYSSRYRNVRRDNTTTNNREKHKLVIPQTVGGAVQLTHTVGCVA